MTPIKKSKKKILVIDDEPDFLKLIQKRLESHHFECAMAENPVEGLQKALSMQPHLILLDLMMPKMSGFGFLRIAKGNPRLAGIPVVVLTAMGDEEVAREAMDLGAVAYLIKSIPSKELMEAIQEYAA